MTRMRTALLIQCSRAEAERIRSKAQSEHRTLSDYVLNIVMNHIAWKHAQLPEELNREPSASPLHSRRKREPTLETGGLGHPQQSEINKAPSSPKIPPGGRLDTASVFLISHLNLALTFIRMAASSGPNGMEGPQLLAKARLAYDSVLKFSNRAGLTDAQRTELDSTLLRLRSELEKRGREL